MDRSHDLPGSTFIHILCYHRGRQPGYGRAPQNAVHHGRLAAECRLSSCGYGSLHPPYAAPRLAPLGVRPLSDSPAVRCPQAGAAGCKATVRFTRRTLPQAGAAGCKIPPDSPAVRCPRLAQLQVLDGAHRQIHPPYAAPGWRRWVSDGAHRQIRGRSCKVLVGNAVAEVYAHCTYNGDDYPCMMHGRL